MAVNSNVSQRQRFAEQGKQRHSVESQSKGVAKHSPAKAWLRTAEKCQGRASLSTETQRQKSNGEENR